LPQINFLPGAREEHWAQSINGDGLMFLFFDFFARTLNYEPGRPRDLAEERREASMGARRVQARQRQAEKARKR